MQSRDTVTIIFTFFCGFAAGMYLYVLGFAPQVAKITSEFSSPADPLSVITIEGRQYGGCARTGQCASFQVRTGGEYNYLPTSVPTSVGTFGGSLTRQEWRTVTNALSENILIQNSEPITSVTCASYIDGIDYEYQIQYRGEVHVIDTCTTSYQFGSHLGAVLEWFWEYFAYESNN